MVAMSSTKKEIFTELRDLQKDYQQLKIKKGLAAPEVPGVEGKLLDLISDTVQDYPKHERETFAGICYNLSVKYLAECVDTFAKSTKLMRVSRSNTLNRRLVQAGINDSSVKGYMYEKYWRDLGMNPIAQATPIIQISDSDMKKIKKEVDIFDALQPS